MQQELKQQIATEALAYSKSKKLSNNDVARLTGVNAGYISQIFNGKFETEVNGKPVAIGDTHFHKIAIWANILTKKSYWHIEPTRQFHEIITTLEDCKSEGSTAMIIAKTGLGKTHAIDAFCYKHPAYTYRITVNSLYNLKELITELGDKVGIDANVYSGKRMSDASLKLRMDKVAAKLIEIKHSGGEPILIIDEGENMEIALLKVIKGLFDIIKNHCSIVLFGTDKLIHNMLNTSRRNRNSIPELYRRFKAGQRNLSSITKAEDFKPFFDKYKVPAGLRKLLCVLCENYGELHDYLQPTLKECDQKGIELSEDFFRLKWNITGHKN